jgi:hypothetical protein
MSYTVVNDRVLDRVRKLLAMANDARGNENESANAAAMAQAIIAEHGLEMSQLENQSNDPALVTRDKTQHDRAAMYKYQRDLMASVAKCNFCRHFITDVHAVSSGKMRKVKRHVLLGRTINVQASILIYDYLIDAMDRLVPWQGSALRGRDALLWFEGCAERLGERLSDHRRAMEEESENKRTEEATRARHPSAAPASNALVLADAYSSEDDLNEDFEQGYELGTTAQNRLKWKAIYAARAAAWLIRKAELQAEGVSDEVIRHMSYGYTREQAEEQSAKYRAERLAHETGVTKPMTEKQKADAERKERVSENRHWNYNQKRNSRLLHPSRQRGYAEANGISLNDQVGADRKERIG